MVQRTFRSSIVRKPKRDQLHINSLAAIFTLVCSACYYCVRAVKHLMWCELRHKTATPFSLGLISPIYTSKTPFIGIKFIHSTSLHSTIHDGRIFSLDFRNWKGQVSSIFDEWHFTNTNVISSQSARINLIFPFNSFNFRVNCSFYFKIGACRHGDRCSRIHNKPTFSQTVLLQNLYVNPQNSAKSADGSHCK